MLEIKNLGFAYQNQEETLKGISFKIASREILAIIGESGSGKSTLLSIISGYLDHLEGSIFLDGKKLHQASSRLIPGYEGIKIVKQDLDLFPNLSIEKNLAYELRFYKENYRDNRVKKLLKIAKLTEVKDHLPRHVSGGQRQRAAIAKAVAELPKVLLLDEPFSSLDILNKKTLKDFVLTLAQSENMAVAYITHEISEALKVADQIMILKNGRIVRYDSPVNIYEHPKNAYVAQLTGEVSIVTMDQKKYFIRPEQILLHDKGGQVGIVNKCEFWGSYYLIEFKQDSNAFKAFSKSKMALNETVTFDILKKEGL